MAARWPRWTEAEALGDIERRGIRHLFYLQVDNPLVDICGREFVGYHLLADSEFSTQVVAKRDPLDRVGNVVQIDGRLMVIEYSDLPDDAARRHNADGSLAIWAGSIAVHVMDAAFLRRLVGSADALPFHIAKKKVIAVDPLAKDVQPHSAIKFERFIDLMPQAERAIVVEVDQGRAFAPLKNAPGAKADTAQTVQAQMAALAPRVAPSGGRGSRWRRAGRDQSALCPRCRRPGRQGSPGYASHQADVFRRIA